MFINQYLGLTSGRDTKAVYRFSSDCHGPGDNRVAPTVGGFGMFYEANMREYDDRKTGMGLSYNRPKYLYGYGPGKLYTPNWWGGRTSWFYTPHAASHMLGYAGDYTMRPENNCFRWFQGHRGPGGVSNTWSCYNPRSGSNGVEKCFSHGYSCVCDGQGESPAGPGRHDLRKDPRGLRICRWSLPGLSCRCLLVKSVIRGQWPVAVAAVVPRDFARRAVCLGLSDTQRSHRGRTPRAPSCSK